MATRIYTKVSGAVGVTPSTWNFAQQINPVTVPGTTIKNDGSTMTSKTEATGVVSPIFRAMGRTVIGPLAAQTISGSVKGQMRGLETNAGANASLAIAIKIVQPNGTDRGVLLATTAADSAVAGTTEFLTALTNAKFLTAAESATLTLTSQAVTAGDYLVIEWGFRSATTTTRNITLSYGNNSPTDLAEDTSTTVANNPWWEFTHNIVWLIQGDTIPSGVSLPVPVVAVEQPLTGASIGTGALVTAPELVESETPAQGVTGETVGVGSAATAPTVAYGVDGATIASGATLPEPVVVVDQPLFGASIGSGLVLTPPEVSGASGQAVTSETIAATAVMLVPEVAAGVVTVVGATLTAGSNVLLPVVTVGQANVSGALVPSGALVRVPTVAAGPVTVTAGTFTSPSQAFAPPTLAVGPATVTGATRGPTSQVFVPTLHAVTAGATIGSTSGAFGPSVTLTVTTAIQGTTSQLFVPTVAPPIAQVTGATVAAASQVFFPAVAVGAATVIGAHRSTTTQLFEPTAIAAGGVAGQTIPSTFQMFTPTVAGAAVTVVGTTITNVVQLVAPLVTVTPVGIGVGALGSTAQMFVPTVVAVPIQTVVGGTCSSTAQMFACTVAAVPTGPSQDVLLWRILSTAQLFPPAEVYWRRASSRIVTEKVTVRYLVTAEKVTCKVVMASDETSVMVNP